MWHLATVTHSVNLHIIGSEIFETCRKFEIAYLKFVINGVILWGSEAKPQKVLHYFALAQNIALLAHERPFVYF